MAPICDIREIIDKQKIVIFGPSLRNQNIINLQNMIKNQVSSIERDLALGGDLDDFIKLMHSRFKIDGSATHCVDPNAINLPQNMFEFQELPRALDRIEESCSFDEFMKLMHSRFKISLANLIQNDINLHRNMFEIQELPRALDRIEESCSFDEFMKLMHSRFKRLIVLN